jgi:hypothetical protein
MILTFGVALFVGFGGLLGLVLLMGARAVLALAILLLASRGEGSGMRRHE